MGKKKKLSEKVKLYNVILVGILSLFVLALSLVLVDKMFNNKDYYKVRSRINNIEKSKTNDTDGYETIGWVRVQGTNIDYPLYGLIHSSYDYPVNESYLWSLNMDSKFHNVMLTYGHNIMNLGSKPALKDETFTRLEELMAYVYYDFAKDNKYIQLTMNGTDYLYKIFAVNFMYVADLNEYPEGEFSQSDRDKYLDRLLEESIYDYNIKIDDDDKILSVATCTRFFEDGLNYDFIVTGKLVKPGEKVNNYRVTRNKNYEKIANLLKGDENDEN